MSANNIEQTTKSSTVTILPSTGYKVDYGFGITFSITFMRSPFGDTRVDTFARTIYDSIDPKTLLDTSIALASNSLNLGLEKQFHDHFVTVVDDYAMPRPAIIHEDDSTTPKLKTIREMEIESIRRLSDKMAQTVANEGILCVQQLSEDKLKIRAEKLKTCFERIKKDGFATENDLCISLNKAKTSFPPKRIKHRCAFFTTNVMNTMAEDYHSTINSSNNQDNQTRDLVSQGDGDQNQTHEPAGGQNQNQNQNQDIQNRDFGFGGQTHGFGSQTHGFGSQTYGFGGQTHGFGDHVVEVYGSQDTDSDSFYNN